jgi:hypothetical protein
VPALEAASDRFRAVDTQVLGVSIDSVHCHANWARDLGGVSFPLLSDFEPKGAVARTFGHYLAEAGITDRATVIVDKAGIVRYSHSVTPSGKRDVEVLLAEAARVHDGPPSAAESTAELPVGSVLFVKSHCGHSRRALVAIDNLHLRDRLAVANVTQDAAAAAELRRLGGKEQAPCLVMDGEPLYESEHLIRALADRIAPL